MKRHEALWRRVNEVLDQRADPLADPAIREHLAEFPEDLALLERLGARLTALAPPPRPQVTPSTPAGPGVAPAWPVLCGAAAGLLLALWSPALDPPASSESPTPAPIRAAAVPAIHDFRLDWVVDDGATRTHRILTPQREILRLERLDEPGVHSPIALAFYQENPR